jgi:hypothetical protein
MAALEKLNEMEEPKPTASDCDGCRADAMEMVWSEMNSWMSLIIAKAKRLESNYSDQTLGGHKSAQNVEEDKKKMKIWRLREWEESVNIHWNARMQCAENSQQLGEV